MGEISDDILLKIADNMKLHIILKTCEAFIPA